MAKNSALGVPEYSGHRKFNETGDEFTGVYNFKDPNREKHFRIHKLGADRLEGKEIKTEWHSAMQARFLRLDDRFKHEVHYQGVNNRRQADIVYDDRICVELQYSSISKEELLTRTEDALHKYEKVVWIFNFDTMIKSTLYTCPELKCRINEELNYCTKGETNPWPNSKLKTFEEFWKSKKNYLTEWEYDMALHGPKPDYWKNKIYKHFMEDAWRAEEFYLRASTAPVWSYLVDTPQEYSWNGYHIKDYKGKCEHNVERMKVIHHHFNDEDEYFYAALRGLRRKEAKELTDTTDFQKRYPFVTAHTAGDFDEIVYNDISGEYYNE